MYVLSATPKYFCEGCRTRIPIVDLEAIFLDQLKGFFANPERIAEHIRRASEAVAEKEQLLAVNQAEVAKVKEEARGIVITLSGSVLFATGKYDLLPIAREKLDEVAKALNDQGYKSMLVEGHMDSVGSASANETLSLKRAESVRTYLVSRGVPSDKIRASGLGSSRPISENTTPDGRANNRRVEIVVEPLK